MVAFLRTFGARRTKARDFSQFGAAAGNQLSKPRRRPLALLALILALGRELLRRVEAHQTCSGGIANDVYGVSVGHREFLGHRCPRCAGVD